MGMVSEFGEFLEEYKVIGLAVAFIVGSALTTLSQSLVNNVIMPVVGIFLPEGAWQTATVKIGPAVIGWGTFASALINFIILALVVFLLVRTLIRDKKPSGKPARKGKRGGLSTSAG